MNKKIIFISVIILAISVSISFSQHVNVEKFVLDNGLTVLLSEDHAKPKVFGGVIVNAGGKDDPKDATGMAHYQEHMLFKGTEELGTINWGKEKIHIDNIFKLYDDLGKTEDDEKRKEIQKQINEESLKAAEYAIPNELSNLIKSMGGTNLNAGTGPDNTVFYNAFPSNQIEPWLDLYSHRFINPVFRSFQAELEVVYEEKNMYQDMFFFPLFEKFNEYFFKQHPYGQQTLIGTTEDLKNPSLTKMYDFFKTYYVPNNMALILVGDFNSDEIKPLIKEKFGKWKKRELPEPIKYKEEPFTGREYAKVKMSPIGLGILGFRSAPSGHKDKIPLEICNRILSNENQTGILDKIVLDNKIMVAQVFSMPYKDYGASLIFFVPKILGQNLDDAEQLILSEMKKLNKGEFDDWMIDAIKNELYVEYMMDLESIEDKAMYILGIFTQGKDIDYINKIPDIINSVSKEDVIKIANKYYGDNYLAFHSKMGFPKKDKIEKPEFEPLKVNTNAKSKYTKYFDKLKTKELIEKYIDIKKDVTKSEFEGCNFYYTNNPVNDIFTFKIKYGIGEYKLPMIKYASEMMNYAGTKDKTVNEFKNEFSKLGCSYYIYSNNSYLIVEVNGIEKNYKEAGKLILELITNPVLEQDKIKNLIDGEKTNRKIEKSEPDAIADALFDYVRFKEKSQYIERLSMKEIKALQATDLVDVFKKATGYFAEIHFIGTLNDEELPEKSANALGLLQKVNATKSPIYQEREKYNENIVYFVNKKKARQSKIFFFANGKPFSIENKPNIDAFNMYFGGGFSGLVLQEIREYRSMAYSAGARFGVPIIKGKNADFIGYIGTQADKTNEAIEIFTGLVREMPQKKERMQMIKDYLIQSALTNQPLFRNLSSSVVKWELLGYDSDPAKYNVPKYKQLEFSDINIFYQDNLKEIPLVTIIVGNKKSIDMKKLSEYGKIIEIKEKKLFND